MMMPVGGPPPGGGMGPPPGAMPMGGARPSTEQVQPLQPPYLASGTAKRAGGPAEPWAEVTKLLLMVFGIGLLVAFVAPWSISPTSFSWTKIGDASTYDKVRRVLILGTGVLALVFAFLPLSTSGRGIAAAALGAVALTYVAVGGPKFQWQSLVQAVAPFLLVGGLLVRSQYKNSMLARILVTIGALGVIAVFLIPAGGKVPLVGQLKAIGSVPGKAKPEAFMNVVPFFLAVLSLIAWVPAPSTAAGTGIAWAWIVLPIVAGLIHIIALPSIGTGIKTGLSSIFWVPIVLSAWTGLAGYGTATLVGKSHEA